MDILANRQLQYNCPSVNLCADKDTHVLLTGFHLSPEARATQPIIQLTRLQNCAAAFVGVHKADVRPQTLMLTEADSFHFLTKHNNYYNNNNVVSCKESKFEG